TCILNSGGYFVNLLPFLAMRKEPPYKNSIVLFILSIIRGSFQLYLLISKREADGLYNPTSGAGVENRVT
ncbi:hypothetical protein, partial [Streptococcus sp. S784/96/1]|uniref:hypothetical protein n=1 Tax=Streptococcus sp. S784/96/1 TaxID=2653499 RepID=UPI001EE3CA56